MVDFATLNTCHPDYDAELIEKLELLYEGGFEILKHAERFVPRAPNEAESRYEFRLKQASYVPFFGHVIGYLVGALFCQNLQITPAGDASDENTIGDLPDPVFYPKFAEDADERGSPFSLLMREATADALIFRQALIAIDMPPAVDVETRADEEASGAGRAFCSLLPSSQLIDWKLNEKTGKFEWCVLRSWVRERKNPLEKRNTYKIQFKVWALNSAGRAEFAVFETPEIKDGDEPKLDTELRQIQNGKTSFREIPIVRVELPKALWVGNKIGPLCEEHFRRRSELAGGMSQSNVEIPTIFLGPEVPAMNGALPSEVQQDPSRGDVVMAMYRARGYTVLGSGDKFQFVGPSGTAFELTHTELKDLEEKIYRVVDAMALSLSNSGATVRRSGESKREDRAATALVLTHIAEYIRNLGINTYRCISDARSEDVVWVAHGLDSFDLEDASKLVEEATGLQDVQIPSPTFRKEYLTRTALALTRGANPATKAAIQQEIADGVDKLERERELANELAHEAMNADPGRVRGATGRDAQNPAQGRGGGAPDAANAPA